MRRSDREITDINTIKKFISKQQIIRIGFYDNGEIYIVPVNYGFEFKSGKLTFYFHGAKSGRKYELAKTTPNVGFEIDGDYSLVPSEKACGYSALFQSVTGNGKLTLVNGEEEKTKGLNCLMRQTTDKDDFEYPKQSLDSVAVFRLEVCKFSCKGKI
ncbi:MAG: pyridoxamine 5'-phosphate oxidase family protein [Ruminococcus sp.]|nr:pyridoxamine 5'-phosphate oxidase family protein [Ruminococcus sp.]